MNVDKSVIKYFRTNFKSLTKGLKDNEILEMMYETGLNYKKFLKEL